MKEGKQKEDHQRYTSHTWSTHAAYNGIGDGDELSRMVEEIFLSSKIAACTMQSVQRF